jgi:hypothetical protein
MTHRRLPCSTARLMALIAAFLVLKPGVLRFDVSLLCMLAWALYRYDRKLTSGVVGGNSKLPASFAGSDLCIFDQSVVQAIETTKL